MQLIEENDFVTEITSEFNLNISLHDSFVKIINDDIDKQVMDTIDYAQSDEPNLETCTSQTCIENIQSCTQLNEVSISRVTKSERVFWTISNLIKNQVGFGRDSSLPDKIKRLETPYQIYCYVLPKTLELDIVRESIKYLGIYQMILA